jgi:hypothetical protein
LNLKAKEKKTSDKKNQLPSPDIKPKKIQ